MKKIITVTITVFVIISLIGCSNKSAVNNNFRGSVNTAAAIKFDYDKSLPKFVAEKKMNDKFTLVTDGIKTALYCDYENNTIAVFDKCNGYLWNATVDKSTYKADTMNLLWVNYMSSLIAIRAYKPEDEQLQIKKFYSTGKKNSTTLKKVNDKIIFTFNFLPQNISLQLIIGLKDNRLVAEVPASSIKEGDGYKLVSVEVMPFFGASGDDVKGYFTIPDGSGALMNYKPSEGQTNLSEQTFSVYSQPVFDSGNLKLRKKNSEYNLALSLFGVKNANNACVVYSTDGMEDAELSVSPSGNIVPFNRAAFKYTYRYTYDAQTSNIVVGDDSSLKVNGNDTKSMVTKMENDLIKKDRRQEIIFLNGENADYSGMANAYRNYLIENKLVHKNITEEMPLSLNVFCGIEEKQLLFKNFISMTSFKQAGEIVDSFTKEGINNLQLTLEGWSKGGYGESVSGWSPESRLGGEEQLTRLANKLSKNQSQLYLKIDPLTINKSAFVGRNEMIILGNNTPATGNSGKVNYFEPHAAVKGLEKVSQNTAKLNNIGLSVDYLGSLIYKNYNKSGPTSRGQTMGIWNDELKKIFNTQRVAVDTGNMYALKSADMIFNIPLSSSQYLMEDTDIPFLQMVLYGLIPYYTEPGNLSYDMNLMKLKWIEYGAIPNFEVTYNKTQNLKNTSYNALFSSTFERWFPTIKEVITEMRSDLKPLWGSYMIKHEVLENDVIKIIYSNHNLLYINYSETEKKADGEMIMPKNYKVVRNGVK